MKKILSLILGLVLLMMTSCGGKNTVEQEEQTSPVTSCSIEEGSELRPGSIEQVVLRFYRVATISKPENILLNGEPIQATVNQQDRMEVVIQLPQDEQDYTLELKQGAISLDYLTETKVNAEFVLHYSIKGYQKGTLASLSNPDAIPSAVNVYNFLSEQFGQKTLSSTIANVNWNFSEAELVYKATGKYPAIATMDYIHMFTLTSHNPFNGWRVPYDDTREVEAWWQNNGLISAGWHWNMPANEAAINNTEGYTCTPGAGTIGTKTTTCAKPSNIMKEGTWEKRIADEDLAKMAELLLLLQNKGIPVIWRPLHEASGNTYGQWAGGGAWFWWGIEGATAYKNLWRYMYDYFKSHGVNNLIWVWTSQNNGDTDWYPGDEYVDIVGQDIYNQGAAANAADYIRLQATYPNKIVTLSECGNVGKISEQWAAGARWSYFMPWYQYNASTLDGHEHANTQWWQDAMKCPYVISRDQMPSLK